MRILLVEDEVKLAGSLKKALEAMAYTVDVAFDGLEGYEAAGVEEYDLIMLDWNLPSLSGVDVCRKLREEGVAIPIIMLTARDALSDKITGLDQGADDYIIKPFALEELLARIRSLLRRQTTPSQVDLQIADLKLDPNSRLVTRDGKEIKLSAKEYAMVEYFLRNPNQIISKSSLLDHVWGNEVDPFSNVIDVYIGYLRRKIDKAFPKKPPLVHTIKGLGYRIGIESK
jgi:two-component system, OmpR family, copper resistance phosphate regulon response regulator CusR